MPVIQCGLIHSTQKHIDDWLPAASLINIQEIVHNFNCEIDSVPSVSQSTCDIGIDMEMK